MNKKYYDLLGVTEEMTDEQIAALRAVLGSGGAV